MCISRFLNRAVDQIPHTKASGLTGARSTYSRICESSSDSLRVCRSSKQDSLFSFCLFNELLSAEPETRVHHDILLYHNIAYFSISFGVFGAHQSQQFSKSNCHPPLDKLLKCPVFYQFFGSNIEDKGAVRLFQRFINLKCCPGNYLTF